MTTSTVEEATPEEEAAEEEAAEIISKSDDNGARPIGYDTRDDFEQTRDENEGID